VTDLARAPTFFDLDAYDAGCLELRVRLDRLAEMEALGRAETLASGLAGTARALRGHFGMALETLGADLPDGFVEALDALARRAASGDPEVLREGLGQCLRAFRDGHALVLAGLPQERRERLALAQRLVRRRLLASLALAACGLGLVLAAPALERAWQGFERNNFVHDFVREDSGRPGLRIAGAYGPEADGERRWRWGWGTRTIVALELDNPGPVRLDYAVSNPLEGQSLAVVANGEILAVHGPLPGVTGMARSAAGSVRFEGRTGLNAIVFEHPLVNHFTFTGDDTPFSVAFLELRLAAGLRAGR